jgi:phosphoribosylaminoimidazole-succinocarboxamide synthase
MRQIDLSRTLPQARIAELPNPYFGKVRDCYDLPDGTRLLISSDRISAFDRILAVIPWKGQVLTQLARYWFEKTEDIAANHVIVLPRPNVVLGKQGHHPAGGNRGARLPCGHDFDLDPDAVQGGRGRCMATACPTGAKDNQALPQAIITPTSKAFDGGHDEPLTRRRFWKRGLLTQIAMGRG